jgi:hypothetical protein
VFVNESPWPVAVLYRNIHTVPEVDPVLLSHLRFGHADCRRIDTFLEKNIATGISLEKRETARCNPATNCSSVQAGEGSSTWPLSQTRSTTTPMARSQCLLVHRRLWADLTHIRNWPPFSDRVRMSVIWLHSHVLTQEEIRRA